MKKLISVMLAALMVLSLGVVAFAEQGSVLAEPGVTVESADGLGMGESLVVEPVEQPLTDAEKADAQDLAKQKVGDGAKLGDPFEIHVEFDNGEVDENAGNVTVVFTYDGEGTPVGVLYQRADGGWDYATATGLGGGRYQVTFAHFCTAILVFNAETTPSNPTNPTPSTKPAASDSQGVTSPKTGWD